MRILSQDRGPDKLGYCFLPRLGGCNCQPVKCEFFGLYFRRRNAGVWSEGEHYLIFESPFGALAQRGYLK